MWNGNLLLILGKFLFLVFNTINKNSWLRSATFFCLTQCIWKRCYSLDWICNLLTIAGGGLPHRTLIVAHRMNRLLESRTPDLGSRKVGVRHAGDACERILQGPLSWLWSVRRRIYGRTSREVLPDISGYCLRVGMWMRRNMFCWNLGSSEDSEGLPDWDWHVIGGDCAAVSRLQRCGKVFNLYSAENTMAGIGAVKANSHMPCR
jgi:hypothetical protein